MTRSNLFHLHRQREPEPAETKARAWVRRHLAMLCADCPALYESDGGPCPACGSPHAFPVAKWLDREPTAPPAGPGGEG